MSSTPIILLCVGYVLLLFLLASYAERREKKKRSLVNNPVVYALSLAVYCTAWTYYGSVGRASSSGIGFLPIYLGPAIFAPIWWVVLRKIVLISKNQRITSVADFISSRYGKSTWLGVIATLIAVAGIIPYISIQLKAISSSFSLLNGSSYALKEIPFYYDPALFIAIALAIFTILFGTRNLDPNERHAGLVAAIAFESILKLAAFMAVGLFVVFGLYNGFEDLFSSAQNNESLATLFDLRSNDFNAWEWFWLIVLSMSAILFLPRQFHVAVVENNRSSHIAKASWLFPLYLLLINIFVIPIALAGMMLLAPQGIEPDTFVLNLPLSSGHNFLALFVALGGFSAATSMVIVAVIALSIMIGNNIVLPLIIRSSAPALESSDEPSLNKSLLGIRRISIIVVLLLSYGYFKAVGEQYSLVSVGLISFTAIAQFLPAIIGGIYWKRGTKKGAMSGLIVGFLVWAYTLPLPTLVESGVLQAGLIQEGLWGLEFLKPYELFGLQSSSQIANAAFWSLLLNSLAYFFTSLYTQPSALEVSQADLFVNIYKYGNDAEEYGVVKRKAAIRDLQILMNRFLGTGRADVLLKQYARKRTLNLEQQKYADAQLINYIETHLAGSIGAASAKLIIASITKDDPISLEEMLRVLEQTQEVLQYSRALEKKSAELEQTTRQLKEANEQLKELDDLKAEFIATVTHELRTPITSIRSLSKIMLDTPALPLEKRQEFLEIVVNESQRLSRLINQVLDLEKNQSGDSNTHTPVDLAELLKAVFLSLQQLMEEQQIDHQLHLPEKSAIIRGNTDQLKQMIINLLSNAIKFCDAQNGQVWASLELENQRAVLKIADNGKGIAPQDQKLIFDKFTQVSDHQTGKPKGSGLGLFITHSIVQQHQGQISVQSAKGGPTTFVILLPLLG
jgi:Na+/proline symporter/nitrogen-specific signal transduction histidine kinase